MGTADTRRLNSHRYPPQNEIFRLTNTGSIGNPRTGRALSAAFIENFGNPMELDGTRDRRKAPCGSLFFRSLPQLRFAWAWRLSWSRRTRATSWAA